MYYENNVIVEKAFDIVDVVRQKCGGEKFYLMPMDINETATRMIELQFGEVKRIVKAYKEAERKEGYRIIVSHE